jgi:hypothetical protein
VAAIYWLFDPGTEHFGQLTFPVFDSIVFGAAGFVCGIPA